jgi:hypothetical protein
MVSLKELKDKVVTTAIQTLLYLMVSLLHFSGVIGGTYLNQIAGVLLVVAVVLSTMRLRIYLQLYNEEKRLKDYNDLLK